jgi:hypothetical protein
MRPFRSLVLVLACLFGAISCYGWSSGSTLGSGFAGPTSGGSYRSEFRDIESLRRCLASPGSLCVPAHALILQPGIRRLNMAGNVTLDGRGMLELRCDSFCLDLRSGNNVIRGVTFVGPGPTGTLWPQRYPEANCTNPAKPEDLRGCAVPIHMMEARQVVIEHNLFRICGEKCVAIDGGDAVTIRNNRFMNSYFGILALGRPGGSTGHLTVAGNVFDTVFRRSARVSGAYVLHEYANVIKGACPDLLGGGFGPSATGEAQALVEYNVADPGSCSTVQTKDYDNRRTGVKLGTGRMTARSNPGMTDRDDPIDFAIPYDYPRLPMTSARRAEIEAAAP